MPNVARVLQIQEVLESYYYSYSSGIQIQCELCVNSFCEECYKEVTTDSFFSDSDKETAKQYMDYINSSFLEEEFGYTKKTIYVHCRFCDWKKMFDQEEAEEEEERMIQDEAEMEEKEVDEKEEKILGIEEEMAEERQHEMEIEKELKEEEERKREEVPLGISKEETRVANPVDEVEEKPVEEKREAEIKEDPVVSLASEVPAEDTTTAPTEAAKSSQELEEEQRQLEHQREQELLEIRRQQEEAAHRVEQEQKLRQLQQQLCQLENDVHKANFNINHYANQNNNLSTTLRMYQTEKSKNLEVRVSESLI